MTNRIGNTVSHCFDGHSCRSLLILIDIVAVVELRSKPKHPMLSRWISIWERFAGMFPYAAIFDFLPVH